MSTFNYSSAEYAEGFKNRDAKIIGDFHQFCVPVVIRRISRKTRSWQLTPESVEDIIQFTYGDVLRKLDEGKYDETGSFLEYFTSFAYTRAKGGDPLKDPRTFGKKNDLSAQQMEKLNCEEPDFDFPMSPEEEEEIRQSFWGLSFKKSLMKYIMRLNANSRECMLLFYKERLSQKEVANYLGKSSSNIGVTLSRGRQNILKWIEEDGGLPA
jgi:RNA polymerase sigma factor (sigma-70 family)